MTTTAIGILLIVQGVLLWAIMAALHRHTSQLAALRERLDALRRRPPRVRGEGAEAAAEDAGDGDKTVTTQTPGKTPRRGLRGLRR
ncbi:MAG: hypothetical protein ACREPL_07080 [Rhodanobacteraceae bacterium]